MFKPALIAALLVAGLSAHAPSQAAVTYHFAENSGSGNLGQGVYAGLLNPVTFDFTVATALAPNTTYTFGYAGVEPTLASTVQSFVVSDGTALSTLSSAVFPSAPVDYGPLGVAQARIQVQTDASAAIVNYVISINGKPSTDPTHVLSFSLSHSGVQPEPQFSLALFSVATFGTVGGVTCAAHPCGGGFTQLAAVPEPGAWTLMLGGLGWVGFMARRRMGR